MYAIHTLTFCLLLTHLCHGYEIINNEVIERIDLDNTQSLQDLSSLMKARSSPQINHHVEGKIQYPEDLNMVQNSFDSKVLSNPQSVQNLVYAAIQNIPQILANKNKQINEDKIKSEITSISTKSGITTEKMTENYEILNKNNDKLHDPKEDKTKDVKVKLYSHLKKALPELYSILLNPLDTNKKRDDSINKNTKNNELSKNHQIGEETANKMGEKSEELTTMKDTFAPYYIIESSEDKIQESTSSGIEDNNAYDNKQEFLKQKYGVKKTVKTHKIGDEKKNVYPKQEIKNEREGLLKPKEDMETDNTIWIGYGLGVPSYNYPYTYGGSSLYSGYYPYGRRYSGWTRGYQGGPYNRYSDRTALSAYNNYGTGFGPYGAYI